MPASRSLSWWQFGLVGGAVLSLGTLVKVVQSIPRLVAGPVPWDELALLPIQVFLMGFACGALVWLVRGLSRRYGAVGDGIVGVLVMNAFFLLCMLLFDRSFLTHRRPAAALMFGLATVVGLVGGVWTGHDLRRELGATQDDESR